MKVKLTVTVDEKLAAQARAKALREKRSLSSIVEQGLRSSALPGSSSSQRIEDWVGAFAMPKRNPQDPRLDALIDRYENSSS